MRAEYAPDGTRGTTRAPATTLLVCAGDPSADAMGALALSAWRRRFGAGAAEGLGGRSLAAAGLRPLRPAPALGWPFPSPTGILEPLRAVPALWAAVRAMEAAARRPDARAALLVDLPDVNLPLGRRLRRAGVPVVQLVAPQTWAWRPSRNLALRESCDVLAVIFPFEEPFFRSFGIDARFVGHPLADRAEAPAAVEPPRGGSPLRLALLPGSRLEKIRRVLGVMLEGAARAARGASPARLEIVVSRAADAPDGLVERAVAASGIGAPVSVETRPPLEWLAGTHQAWVCAGTASLEVAWAGVPACVVFRTDPVGFALARRLVRGRFGGMANRLLGRELMPELIQRDCTAEGLASVFGRLRRPEAFAEASAGAAALRAILGRPGFAGRVAEILEESASSRQVEERPRVRRIPGSAPPV